MQLNTFPTDKQISEAFAAAPSCPGVDAVARTVLEGTEEERQRLLAHAETCAACTAEIELVDTWTAAGSSQGQIEDATIRRIRGRVLPRAPRTGRLQRFAAAAAVLLSIGGALVFLSSPRPPALPERDGSTPVVRGVGVELVEPVGDVSQLPDTWRWSTVDGAELYRLSILRVDGEVELVAETTEPVWRPSAHSLSPSVNYGWKVEAFSAGERLATSPVVLFRFAQETH